MPVSLAEVLDLDVVRRAAPRVAHGEHLLDRAVRWVHTSELVEAAALLKGGELLLTTGLGLAGRGPVAQRSYVVELAERGASALVLELGWTFAEVPEALLDAARDRELPLIALHEIIPFVEITEEVQRQILHANVAELTLERDVTHLLHDLVLRGDGLAALVDALAATLSCAVVLEEVGGTVVAGGRERGSSPRDRVGEVRSAPVEVLGSTWGRLTAVDPPPSSRTALAAVLDAGAAAVALTLLRGAPPPSTRARQRREFVQDLLAGRLTTADQRAAAAAPLGLALGPRTPVTGFAVGGYPSADGPVLLDATVRAAATAGESLVAEVDGQLLGVLAGTHWSGGNEPARSLLDAIDASVRRRGADRPSRLAMGPNVRGAEPLGRTVRDARAALRLADDLGLPERIVTARGMIADRLLAPVIQDRELSEVVDDALGPLLEHDAAHGTDLIETLYCFLCHGGAKSAVAASLHVRRQTLYKRLARIESLMGDLSDPEWRASLLVAVRAHRLVRRSAAAVPRRARATRSPVRDAAKVRRPK